MTVKKLISLLKKMPQNLEVAIADQDNSEWEVSGWPTSVFMLDKDEVECPDWVGDIEKERYESLPKRVVVIR